jgi:hypothetical protein
MEERRRQPRTEINVPALVSAGGSVMTCVVRNISPDGAAIDVENSAFVPPRFRLVMDNGASVRDCTVAWIQKNRIGLVFDAKAKSGQWGLVSVRLGGAKHRTAHRAIMHDAHAVLDIRALPIIDPGDERASCQDKTGKLEVHEARCA